MSSPRVRAHKNVGNYMTSKSAASAGYSNPTKSPGSRRSSIQSDVEQKSASGFSPSHQSRSRSRSSASSHVSATVNRGHGINASYVPALGSGKSIVEAVREMKNKLENAEEEVRREKQQRMRLQGVVADLEENLESSRSNTKQLEDLIAKLNRQDRELRVTLEQEAKRIEDLEFEKNAAMQAIRNKEHVAELERTANKALASAESAKAKLREEQSLQASLRSQCQEAQTLAKVAKELQLAAEARAEKAEKAIASSQARADSAFKRKQEIEVELSSSRDTISSLKFQVKSVSTQRDELLVNRADLEAQVEALRRELDSISSLFLS